MIKTADENGDIWKVAFKSGGIWMGLKSTDFSALISMDDQR